MHNLKRLDKTFLATWASPLMAGLLAFVVYVIFAQFGGSIFREIKDDYFRYLADAFLHGQLNLRFTPEKLLDLVFYKDKIYLYWAPFPAIMLIPLVAIWGIHIPGLFIDLILASLNVSMVALLLSQLDKTRLVVLDQSRRGLLVLFFACGSVIFPMALLGAAWQMSQLTGALCVVLAYIAAVSLRGRKAFLLTGLALSCAAATRNQLLFTGIWPVYYLLATHWKEGWKRLAEYVLWGVLPIILAIAGLAWYNWARFGSPTDVGIAYHNMNVFFRDDYNRYGYFNIHYIPINIHYQLFFYPFPWRTDSYMGGSLFLLSPVLFAAFWGGIKGRPKLSVLFLIISILITYIPILLLMGTGYSQVGPRYTLDFHIPLIILTAMGIKRWPMWLVSLLVFISCTTYLLLVLFWILIG